MTNRSTLFVSVLLTGICLCISIVPKAIYAYHIQSSLKLVMGGVHLPNLPDINLVPTERDRHKLNLALNRLSVMSHSYSNNLLIDQLRGVIFIAYRQWSQGLLAIEEARFSASGERRRMLSWKLALAYEEIERQQMQAMGHPDLSPILTTNNINLITAWRNAGYTSERFEKVGDFFRIERAELDHALIWYQRAVKAGGDSFSLWYNMGIISRIHERQSDALFAFRRAIEKAPLSQDGWWEVGNLYEQKKEFDKALKAYQQGLVGVGTIGLSNFYAKIGRIYQREGTTQGLDLARIAYRRAAAQNSFYSPVLKVETYYQLGHVLSEQNRWQEAIQVYKQALQLSPHSYAITVDLAVAYWQLGDQERAIALWDRALKQEPNRKEAYIYLGNFYQANGKLTQAQKMYAHARELDQNK